MNPEAFKSMLNNLGYEVTNNFIRKLYLQGFIPKPETRALGRGKGSESNYTLLMLAEAFACFAVKEKFKLKWDDVKVIRDNASKEDSSSSKGFGLIEAIGNDQLRINNMSMRWLLYREATLSGFEPIENNKRPLNEVDERYLLQFEPAFSEGGDYQRNEDGTIRVLKRILYQRSQSEIDDIICREAELKKLKPKVKF